MSIFSNTRAVPRVASAWIQQLAITLSVPMKENANVDTLSRIPLRNVLPEVPEFLFFFLSKQ